MTTPATTPVTTPKITNAEKEPFRKGSVYARIYEVCKKFQDKPVSKKEIIARLKKNGCKETDLKLLFGLNVILSIREDFSAHKRLNRIAKETYWVEKRNDGIFVFHIRS